jgi:hypothetical protein
MVTVPGVPGGSAGFVGSVRPGGGNAPAGTGLEPGLGSVTPGTVGSIGDGPVDGRVTPGTVGGARVGLTSGDGSVMPGVIGADVGGVTPGGADGDGMTTAGPDGGGAGLWPCPQTNIADPAIPNPISARPAARVIHFIFFLPTPLVRAVLAVPQWPIGRVFRSRKPNSTGDHSFTAIEVNTDVEMGKIRGPAAPIRE